MNGDNTNQYDGSGNLVQTTDRKGQITNLAYDGLNRTSRVVYVDGRTTDYIFDLAGNLIRVADSVSGDALYLYDNLNRLTAETTDRGIVSYQYDAIGRLTERRINGQDPTLYAYDRANRPKTITYRGKVTTYSYDAAGRLSSRSLPNGITQALTYDNAGQLLALAYTRTDGSVIERITYSYDDNGNRITRGRIGMGGAPDTAFTATYDAQNRMLTYNGQPLSYDDNGNLVSRQTPQGTISYAWDAKDQLTGISGPNGTAAFRYDHRGRRIPLRRGTSHR